MRVSFARSSAPLLVVILLLGASACPPAAVDGGDDNDDSTPVACDLACGSRARCDASRGEPECVCIAGYEGDDCATCSYGYRAVDDGCEACLDGDGDGHLVGDCGGGDCDDADPRVPASFEEGFVGSATCHDGLDNDCSGFVDGADPQCVPACVDGWCLERFRNSSGLFVSSLALAATDMWIGGESFIGTQGEVGAVMHHWDGARFTLFESPAHARTELLYGLASDDVWATGFEQILHWDGATWTDRRSTITGPRVPTLMWGAAVDDVWGATRDLGLFHWDGAAWTTVRAPQTTAVPEVRGMHGCPTTGGGADVWFAAGQSLLRFDGTGLTELTSEPETSTRAGLAGGPGELFLASERAYVLQGDLLARDVDVDLGALRAIAGRGDAVFAAGDDGALARYDGTGWTPLVTGSSADFIFAFAPVAGEVLLGTRSGLVQRWTGTALEDVASGFDAFDAMFLVDATVGFAAERDRLYRLDGNRWSAETFVEDDVIDLWASGPNDAWGVGVGSRVYHWDGNDWTSVRTGILPNDLDETYRAVAGTGPNDVWVAGDATVLHFDGTTWTQVDTGGGRGFRPRLHAAAVDDVWLFWGNRLLHSTGGAMVPQPRLFVHAVHCVAEGDVSFVASGDTEAVSLWRLTAGALRHVGDAPGISASRFSFAGPDDVWISGRAISGDQLFRFGHLVGASFSESRPPSPNNDVLGADTLSMLPDGHGVGAGGAGAIFIHRP